MTLLIDADWLCYNCCYAVENDDRFDDNLHVLYSRPSWGLDLIETYIQRYKQVSEDEGHHPEILFGWGYAEIKITTHAIKGLSENDFILAAKIDKINV